MDPQIHGAIVGGALAGLTAGVAVVLDVRLRGRIDHRQRLEASVVQLGLLTGRTAAAAEQGDMNAFPELHRLMMEQLSEVLRLAVRRRDRPILEACGDLMDMWMALVARRSKGIAVTYLDALVLMMPIRRMNKVLSHHRTAPTFEGGFGSDRLRRYLEQGIDAPDLEQANPP